MKKEDALKLLEVMECLIDTVAAQTDLENVYDDSENKSVTWDEVWESYHTLKEVAEVE